MSRVHRVGGRNSLILTNDSPTINRQPAQPGTSSHEQEVFGIQLHVWKPETFRIVSVLNLSGYRLTLAYSFSYQPILQDLPRISIRFAHTVMCHPPQNGKAINHKSSDIELPMKDMNQGCDR